MTGVKASSESCIIQAVFEMLGIISYLTFKFYWQIFRIQKEQREQQSLFIENMYTTFDLWNAS